MVHRILFWSGFGLATRAWQLGLQMTPPLRKDILWLYPIYAGCGAGFGYWLQGIEDKQVAVIEERKRSILEKRARRAAKESEEAGLPATA